MAKPLQYYQCRLQRTQGKTTYTKIGWIEARGAKVGVEVELLPSKQFWEVVEVFGSLPEDMLKKHQSMHRKSFASIEPMQ